MGLGKFVEKVAVGIVKGTAGATWEVTKDLGKYGVETVAGRHPDEIAERRRIEKLLKNRR